MTQAKELVQDIFDILGMLRDDIKVRNMTEGEQFIQFDFEDGSFLKIAVTCK